MALTGIKDLADQLTESSEKFVASFQQTMMVEDDLTKFLRGRQRWYVGTQQNSTPGELPQTQATPDKLAEAAEPKKKKCPKPKNVKTAVRSKVDMGKVAAVGGLVIGVGLIVGGIALALADGPQPGPADVAALPIIAQGVNKIVPFIRTAAPLLLAKGGLVTKPTRALIGEAGPEIVVPMHKFGETIKDIYKQSAKSLLAATAGFLASQPNNPSKGKLLGEIGKIKTAFGLGALKIKQSKFGLRAPIKWWNKGRNERVIDENNASWSELLEDDMAQRGQSDESFAAGEAPPLLGRPDQAFNPFRPAEKGGPGSGPTPAVRQAFERPVRGMMNLGKSAAGAIGSLGEKFKEGLSGIRKAIPVPRGNGRDMFGQKIDLNPSTGSAWRKAVGAAARDGIDLPGAVTSAFRTNAEQASLVANQDDPSIITPAPVGLSPHQQGWSIDIADNTPANQWMRDNGNKFGFNWEGPKDPVHFDYKTDETRQKYMEGDKSDWKEDEEKKDTASGIGGKLLQIASGALKGDPADVQPTQGITPPEPSPEQTMVNETPVQQTTKNGTTVVPLPLPVPGATKLVALPPSDVAKLDPEIKRHYVVDQFTKATRVEVAYV
jgi:hypothetical protein